jgi:antitoxin YefM
MLYPLSYERMLRRQSTIRGGSPGSVVGRQLMTYSESRAKYAETLNAVADDMVDDREELVITRAGHDPVVMVAFDDNYESLKETAYLLRSPETCPAAAGLDRPA